MNLNVYIDHTLLKPNATFAEIEKLCQEAVTYDFFSVCVNGCFVAKAKSLLKESNVKVCSVVGFPLGAMSAKAKFFETEQALLDGADEIDMVLNISYLKSGRFDEVQQEIAAIKKLCGNKILKVILETCFLTDEEKRIACELSVRAGADFVKTSTGFGSGGATIADVLLMKNAVGQEAKVKASGGIRDYQTALEYIELGVHRLGTSNGIVIVSQGEINSEQNY